MRFFQTYLQGVRREANECPKDTCTCSQEARASVSEREPARAPRAVHCGQPDMSIECSAGKRRLACTRSKDTRCVSASFRRARKRRKQAKLEQAMLRVAESDARDASGSAEWTSQKRRGRHRVLRTASQPDIYEHHDPAGDDEDFMYMNRAADRLRRVLSDGESRALFLHLELNATRSASACQ